MDILNPSTWSWSDLVQPTVDLATSIAQDKIKEGSNVVAEKVKDQWGKVKWREAAEKYKSSLQEIVSTTKVLGNPKPIEIEKIYTDVYVHDKPSAIRQFSCDLTTINAALFEELHRHERLSAVDAAKTGANLFIVGRPGAGKTTFLKYLAITCCKGQINKTPIFVSLKDWSDSNLKLMDFIEAQFDICGFPDAAPFVKSLLQNGGALILLDGLDEVSEWQNKRNQTIKEIVNLSRKFKNNQYCLTCRTAATDYSFENFDYLEVADFNLNQQLSFVSQWYGEDIKRLERFTTGWKDANQAGLRDLGRTPLLLTLLCLAFDQTFNFPLRQVDLYRDALDALLRKWDSSRLITRDPFYKEMSHSRREHLLEDVAAKFYFDGRVAFQQAELEEAVLKYLKNLPDKEVSGRADAKTVIRQIEAQHGVIVERAAGIYSYSHLTIQEYLTASYLVTNHDLKVLEKVTEKAARDPKWREVMLFSVGLMPRADILLEMLIKQLTSLRGTDSGVLRFLTVALCDATSMQRHKSFSESGLKQHYSVFGYEPDDLKGAILKNVEINRHPALTSAEVTKIGEHILKIRDFLEEKKKKYNFGIAELVVGNCAKIISLQPSKAAELLGGYFSRPDDFIGYLYGCRLLIECLEVAVTSRREEFLQHVMSVDREAVRVVAREVGV